MAMPRSALLLCVVLGAALGARAALFSRSTTINTPVLFFDNKDLDGGSQNFPVVLPTTAPAGGCAPCENLVRPLDLALLKRCASAQLVLFLLYGLFGTHLSHLLC